MSDKEKVTLGARAAAADECALGTGQPPSHAWLLYLLLHAPSAALSAFGNDHLNGKSCT